MLRSGIYRVVLLQTHTCMCGIGRVKLGFFLEEGWSPEPDETSPLFNIRKGVVEPNKMQIIHFTRFPRFSSGSVICGLITHSTPGGSSVCVSGVERVANVIVIPSEINNNTRRETPLLISSPHKRAPREAVANFVQSEPICSRCSGEVLNRPWDQCREIGIALVGSPPRLLCTYALHAIFFRSIFSAKNMRS